MRAAKIVRLKAVRRSLQTMWHPVDLPAGFPRRLLTGLAPPPLDTFSPAGLDLDLLIRGAPSPHTLSCPDRDGPGITSAASGQGSAQSRARTSLTAAYLRGHTTTVSTMDNALHPFVVQRRYFLALLPVASALARLQGSPRTETSRYSWSGRLRVREKSR